MKGSRDVTCNELTFFHIDCHCVRSRETFFVSHSQFEDVISLEKILDRHNFLVDSYHFGKVWTTERQKVINK